MYFRSQHRDGPSLSKVKWTAKLDLCHDAAVKLDETVMSESISYTRAQTVKPDQITPRGEASATRVTSARGIKTSESQCRL